MRRSPARTKQISQQSRVFAVTLLLFMYAAQPALALLQLGFQGQECGAVPACCCTGAETPLQVSQASEPDCCMDTATDEQPPVSTVESCSCSLEPVPLPLPAPCVPPGEIDGYGDSSALAWVRAHSQLVASVPCTQPGTIQSSWMRDAGLGRSPVVPLAQAARAKSDVPTWTLQRRGVSGLLALLSISRL